MLIYQRSGEALDLSQLSKQRLIQIGKLEKLKIYEWMKKNEIIKEIEEHIKNIQVVWIKCDVSGIIFNSIDFGVTNRHRIDVHPQIAKWKSDAEEKHWEHHFYKALKYCELNNFKTIEEFNLVMERAKKKLPLDGSNPEIANLILKGTFLNNSFKYPWVRKIKYCDENNYKTENFITPQNFSLSGDSKFQFLIKKEGYYESKSYSEKDKGSIKFWKFKNNELVEIDKSLITFNPH